MRSIITLLLIMSSVAHAGLRLEDLATPMIKCGDKVIVYAYSEGMAGMKVLGKDYLIDTRITQIKAPAVSIKEISSGDVEVYEFSYKNEWSVKIKLYTDETYNTDLIVNGKKQVVTCRFGK